jgi:2-C-methyl-D-erythritol 4-phosphate cytidylyltransferase
LFAKLVNVGIILIYLFYYLCDIKAYINQMIQTVIIVAGGKGERMQLDIPKQFIEIHSTPILMHTISRFFSYNTKMKFIVVLPENQIENWLTLCKKHAFNIRHEIVAGGINRFDSVKNGLKISPVEGIIAVHDGVRPLVSLETIDRCIAMAQVSGAAIPVSDSIESIRQVLPDGSSKAVNRSEYKMVQTPQAFSAKILHEAYEQAYSAHFTDDASVVEANGNKIFLVEGNKENIKITTPFDLIMAEKLL